MFVDAATNFCQVINPNERKVFLVMLLVDVCSRVFHRIPLSLSIWSRGWKGGSWDCQGPEQFCTRILEFKRRLVKAMEKAIDQLKGVGFKNIQAQQYFSIENLRQRHAEKPT